ncbi:restriction endonuclease subunit S [Alteromonas macleodii]|uniref:restriction endonuclease subunit S n=1 Tax=Alteromonas macleodii TaxID=28108 RepID=UPI00313B4823
MSVESIITENLDVWTSAIKTKSTSGRGSSSKIELYGINKLREMILGLGLSGKLVGGNRELPNDIDEQIEIAKALYSEKQSRRLKEYKIGKPLIHEFEIPKGWRWMRVCQLSDLQTGATPSKAKPEFFGGPYKWLVSGDINRYMIDDCEGRITDKGLANSNCRILKPGTVMIALNGQGKTRATVALLKTEAACNQSLVGITPFDEKLLHPLFLLYALKYRYIEIRDITGQKQRRGLNMGLVAELSIPFPPVDEQKNIVTKIDELMILCDQLESQTEASIEAHQTLVKSLLETLINAKDADELNENWQRISEHFDVLFTTEDSIDQLKQTILQLAVMGKLVKQVPNDEPASKLLERIATEKEQLIKDKKIKKQKPLAPITDDEISSKLPNDWSWCRLNEIISIMDAGWSPACPPEPSPSIDKWGVLKTTAVQKLEFLENENKVLAESKDPKAQYEVKSGDILITRAGPRNRVGISCLVRNTRPRLMISDKIIRFHLVHSDLDEEFISLCLNSGVTAEYLEKSKSGMADSQVNISQDKLKMAPIPLAPLRQQREIVAKVYALWTLCEELKLNVVKLRDISNCVADSFIIHS